MNLRKVSAGDREVLRRYRTQTEPNVSYWHEEFDCGSVVAVLAYKNKKPQPNYGISKREGRVSDYYGVDALRGLVRGG